MELAGANNLRIKASRRKGSCFTKPRSGINDAKPMRNWETLFLNFRMGCAHDKL